MKKTILAIAVALQALTASAQYQRSAAQAALQNVPFENVSGLNRQLFNFDWKFQLGEVEGAQNPDFNDSAWRQLDLPHDFQFELPWNEKADRGRGFKDLCSGWYRKSFSADPSWKGLKVSLDFDGIMYVSDVYVNGTKVGSGEYGYVGYEVDITDVLNYDKPNVVAVYANAGRENGSRWYTGAGIFRDVHLSIKNPTHITRNGIYVVTPEVSSEKASIAVQVEVDGHRGHDTRITARIIDPQGKEVASTSGVCPTLTKHTRVEVNLPQVSISNPQLWSIDSPALYNVEVEVSADGVIVDKSSDHFGIRSVVFSKEHGLQINGEKVFIKGVANHHELGALGAASFDRALERMLIQLKSFGFNSIRCSHNPYSEHLTEIADRLGFLVVDELIDKWSDGQYWDGRKPFTTVWPELITEWIRRDRNSPSVIMWSLGNELQMREDLTGYNTNDWGITMYRIMDVMVKRYDSSRKTTVAMYPSRAGAVREEKEFPTYLVPPELACVTDVASFNYQWPAYKGYLEHEPDLIIFQSEATTRDLLGPFYGMDQDKMVGLSYWGAIEYWGESDGWPKKGWNYSYFSHTLEPYPQAYLMQGAFEKDKPLVRIAVADGSEKIIEWNDVLVGKQTYSSTWNFAKGSTQKVAIFSNTDQTELFVNGKSLGRKDNNNTEPGAQHITTWDSVPYGNGGTIVAVGYNAGKEVARHSVRTAGKAVALKMVQETPAGIKGDGMDLQYIKVYAVDSRGNVVPTYSEKLKVSVSGEGKLLAIDNGDHYTNELFLDIDEKNMKDGFMQIIVRSSRNAGKVTVSAASGNLKATSTYITE